MQEEINHECKLLSFLSIRYASVRLNDGFLATHSLDFFWVQSVCSVDGSVKRIQVAAISSAFLLLLCLLPRVHSSCLMNICVSNKVSLSLRNWCFNILYLDS